MIGHWDGRTFSLDELHRFPNDGVLIAGSLRGIEIRRKDVFHIYENLVVAMELRIN